MCALTECVDGKLDSTTPLAHTHCIQIDHCETISSAWKERVLDARAGTCK